MATVAEIQADIAAVRAARRALAEGKRVQDYWRDGRRLVYTGTTIDQLTRLLEVLNQELAEATAVEGGTRRRAPFGVCFS